MTSEWIELTAADGHTLSAYVAKPQGEAKGAVVVVQEIFGVNASIRGVAEGFAREGFVGIAPALFDRFGKDIQLGYSAEEMQKAFQTYYPKLNKDDSLKDIAAAFDWARGTGKGTAVVGFCYGGLMAWLSATRGEELGMKPACAVGYYAGGVGSVASETPSCPVMLHFGGADDHIGPEQREAVAKAHPGVEIFVYDGAGHAFANPDRSSYVAQAAKLAEGRTLAFLNKHLG